MEELLKKYSSSKKVIIRGGKVKGKVLQKLPKKLILDIGGKSEGVVAEKAFEEARGFIDNLEIGDEVETSVISSESRDGVVLLSLRQAVAKATWDKLIEEQKKGKGIKVIGRFPNPSGIMVEAMGLYGFIPNSQLSKHALKDKEKLVGQEFDALILEVDKSSNRFILSEKASREGITPELVKKAVEVIKEGDVYRGVATTVSDFGVFVEIEVKLEKKIIPIEGLVHVSEMSWEKTEAPSNIVSKGDKVEVKVLGFKNGKLALSMKQSQKDPWEGAIKKYKVDQKISGRITKLTDFGAFVQLEPGVEGLIHITKIPPDKKLKARDVVEASIEEFDAKNRKISLALVLTQKPLLYK